MYFDPLTTWIVALLADGIILSGENVSDAEVAQYYKKQVKESNANLNAELRHRLANKNYSISFEMGRVTHLLEYYKNRFEYRYGAVQLDPDVQELVINLYEESIAEHQKILQTYEDSYVKQKVAGYPTILEKMIEKEKNVEA